MRDPDGGTSRDTCRTTQLCPPDLGHAAAHRLHKLCWHTPAGRAGEVDKRAAVSCKPTRQATSSWAVWVRHRGADRTTHTAPVCRPAACDGARMCGTQCGMCARRRPWRPYGHRRTPNGAARTQTPQHTRARAHARAHVRTHARTHAHAHAHTQTLSLSHTHTHAQLHVRRLRPGAHHTGTMHRGPQCLARPPPCRHHVALNANAHGYHVPRARSRAATARRDVRRHARRAPPQRQRRAHDWHGLRRAPNTAHAYGVPRQRGTRRGA